MSFFDCITFADDKSLVVRRCSEVCKTGRLVQDFSSVCCVTLFEHHRTLA